MNGAFYIGAAGLDAQQRALEVVANNVANINTNGFKRSAVRFSELVAPARNNLDLPVSQLDGASSLAGVTLGATPHVWTQGALRSTGQPLDLAIDGNGFLELLGPSGRTLLWRGGALKINADGELAAADGTVLRGMVSVPQGASQLTIDRNGVVAAVLPGESQSRQIGQLDLVIVKDPDSLVDNGGGYFETTDATQIASVQAGEDGAGSFVQGLLEAGNVQLTDEMVSLLLLQRAYAASSQVVQVGDQLMSIANGLRR